MNAILINGCYTYPWMLYLPVNAILTHEFYTYSWMSITPVSTLITSWSISGVFTLSLVVLKCDRRPDLPNAMSSPPSGPPSQTGQPPPQSTPFTHHLRFPLKTRCISSAKRHQSTLKPLMQTDKSHLSREERAWQISQRLWLYCGESGHRIATCPVHPEGHEWLCRWSVGAELHQTIYFSCRFQLLIREQIGQRFETIHQPDLKFTQK